MTVFPPTKAVSRFKQVSVTEIVAGASMKKLIGMANNGLVGSLEVIWMVSK